MTWNAAPASQPARRRPPAGKPAALFLILLALLPGCRPPTPAAATPPPPAGPFTFVDVQDAAGLRFTHTDGGSGRKFFIEQFCSGCAFFDYDNDGWLDVYAVNGAPLPGTPAAPRTRHELFHNRGNGTFENVTDRARLGSTRFGGGVCAGDYNNDGWLDLYVTTFGSNHLYRNNGDGTFTDTAPLAGVSDPGLSTSAAFLDYDNDGWLDLYVCNYVRYRLEDDRFCGSGRSQKSYCGPEVFPSNQDRLYRNQRDGTFRDVSRASGIAHPKSKSLGVVATDVNDDGWIDLYVACDLVRNLLFINRRNGTFRETAVDAGVAYNADGAAEAGMGVAAGDYDRDGRMDLFVTNYSFEMNALYHNQGGELFSYESERSGIGPPSLVPLGFGTRFADFDRDGWLDVVVANGHVLDDCHEQNQALEYAQRMEIYRNLEGRRFEEVSATAGPAFQAKYIGRGLASGDYDNDGDVDLLVSNNKGPLRLIRNETRAPNHWAALRLVGTRSNRSAIGARVTLRAGNGEQIGEVASGSSYLSQSDLRLCFGLGKGTRIDEVRVRWPGGAMEVWTGLAADQVHELREGASRTEGAKL